MIDLNERDKLYFEHLAKFLNVDPELVRFMSENINSFSMSCHTNQRNNQSGNYSIQ